MNAKWKKIGRILRFSALMCIFFPLFLWDNRGLKKNPIIFSKRSYRFIRRGQFLLAWEAFWSSWNPTITTEITRPIYTLCGGNDHPFFATMVVFLYSGLVIHMLCGWLWMSVFFVIYAIITGHQMVWPPFYWGVVPLYGLFGFPIACTKWWRARKQKNQ